MLNSVRPATFRGYAGVASRDITPPTGIYAALYGAADPVASLGTHRPLVATVLALRTQRDESPMVLVALDHTEVSDLTPDIAGWVVDALADTSPVVRENVMVVCSHTHSAPPLISRLRNRPGGDLFEPYVGQLSHAIADAVREAVAGTVPATITWGVGGCGLATNRDLPDPNSTTGRYVCGYNPDGEPDDTLVVARVTSDDNDEIMATLVNYACHATSLGWDNYLVSPDFVGAMRETVEASTDGAPSIFLQGASGELSPAHQYSGDPAIADGHGRQLGFAALAVLAGMLKPGHELWLSEIVESGAPLAVWSPRPFDPDRTLVAEEICSALPLIELPTSDALADALARSDSGWEATRILRKQAIAETLGSKRFHETPAWVWRIGGAILVGHPNEAYSNLQTSLRAAFPDAAVMVMNLVNDSDVVGYLWPRELADLDLYQIWQSPFGAGSLELLIDTCETAIASLLKLTEVTEVTAASL